MMIFGARGQGQPFAPQPRSHLINIEGTRFTAVSIKFNRSLFGNETRSVQLEFIAIRYTSGPPQYREGTGRQFSSEYSLMKERTCTYAKLVQKRDMKRKRWQPGSCGIASLLWTTAAPHKMHSTRPHRLKGMWAGVHEKC